MCSIADTTEARQSCGTEVLANCFEIENGVPLILAHDVGAVVVRVGPRVRRFKAGDEVYARPADGRNGASVHSRNQRR
jgi:NADPH:quinone reductase-like Zn-dependent oxidoreductase